MEDHIPERPDRSLLIGRQTSKWSLWDLVFHENDSTSNVQVVHIIKKGGQKVNAFTKVK